MRSQKNNMDSIRQQKVASLLKRDIGEILTHHGPEYLPGKMLTVTTVRMSPDLSFAKVYISIFPSEDLKADITKLKNHEKPVRGKLGNRVKNQLRIVPEIAFYLDDSQDYVERIDELLG